MEKYLKPAPGRKVRNPQTFNHLPDDGALIVINSYWRRRLKDGDVVISKAPKTPKDKKE